MTKYTKTFADAMKEVRRPKVVKEDYEVSMAIGQLKTIQDRVGKIMDFLSGKSDDYNMEAWLQSKITSAEDKLNSVATPTWVRQSERLTRVCVRTLLIKS